MRGGSVLADVSNGPASSDLTSQCLMHGSFSFPGASMTVTTWMAVGEAVWVIALCVWIILERRSPTATLAWVLALAWLPVLGIPLYLLIGPRRLRRKKLRHRRSRSRVIEASQSWREPADAVSRASLPAGNSPQLVKLAESVRQPVAAQAERVDLLLGGDACYEAIERAISEARHHVHLEYYTWEPDRVGTRFRDLLCDKARSGVEVRLLVDAIGSAWFGRRFGRPLREAGVQFARFNPISLARLRPDLVNFRTHRKIVVCDGRVGFTGGINVCDEHAESVTGTLALAGGALGARSGVSHWATLGFPGASPGSAPAG